ncbi:sulfurtransferase complex subunit TusC [Psychromonas sp. MME2]
MTEKTIGIINRSLPHGSSAGRESLDLTLAMSAFNESLSIFFIGDGIYQLLKGQSPLDILQKHYQPLFKMLELYDVENRYVCAHSMAVRGVTVDQLIIDVTPLDKAALQLKLAQQVQLLSF